MAFGHEINVTTVQMASAFATIANDGVRVQPRVIRGVAAADGELTLVESPPGRRVVGEQTARTVTSLLEGVVIRGTGTAAAVPGYRLAGKTGTAQKFVGGSYSDTQYVASFGGYGPVRDPRLVGMVVLDTPRGDEHTGGGVAAPVFGRVMADALAYLRVPPDEDPLDSPTLQAGGRVGRDTLRGSGAAGGRR